MRRKALINRYQKACSEGKEKIDMDIMEVAGYYIGHYPNDPIGALMLEIDQLKIPNTKGQAARVVITAVVQSERNLS